jgi:glycyl-tRNA synthetase alpha chain
VWLDGMEVTQFTYFQQCGGLDLPLISAEITYGLERLTMYLQGKESVYDLVWTYGPDGRAVTYGEVHHEDEVQFSAHNFEHADVALHLHMFSEFEKSALKLVADGLVLPAYDYVMKASHAFNVLDARGAISVTERQKYIGRVRGMARQVALGYEALRYRLGLPLCSAEVREPLLLARQQQEAAEAEKKRQQAEKASKKADKSEVKP